MTNHKILELYDSGYISGEAFLYCVDNNLYTVQDVVESGFLEESSVPYGKEFTSYLEAQGITLPQPETDDYAEKSPASEEVIPSNSDVEAAYNKAISEVDIRTIHALEKMQSRYDDFRSFLYAFTQNDKDFWEIFEHLPAVGKKSIERARKFADFLCSEMPEFNKHNEANEHPSIISTKEKKYELDGLGIFFNSQLQTLSTRSYNAVSELYEMCGKSFGAFYEMISSPTFRIKGIPNIGKKSAEELNVWFIELKHFVDNYLTIGLTDEQFEYITLSRLQLLGIKGELAEIQRLYEHLSYFPYFAAIQSFFTSLTDREQRIIEYQLDFFNSKDLYGLKEASRHLGLTSERTRQLRSGVFEVIHNYIQTLTNILNSYPLSESYFSLDAKQINVLEGTNFNDDFIRWGMSIFEPEKYTLLGNIEDAFFNPYGKEIPLVLVPKKYNDVFDFESFIEYLSYINDEKRVDDRDVILNDCVLSFFKDRIYYEFLDDIIRECKSIINILFDFEISNEIIHIKKNSERNNPELVEQILREFGHPMTIDEIYAEFQKRYPNHTKSANALAGALRLNPNIACVSRSSTYTLTEWTHGEHRGGTIREFATEFLLSQSPSIAALEDIGNYVRQFRPTSSDKSIHANLLLEGAFNIFYKDDIRYIGFANQVYPEEYRKFCPKTDSRRDFKSSCTLLEKFVAENGRMPFSSDVSEDEKRLCRFWNIHVAKLKNNLLGEEEKCMMEQLLRKFESFKIDKREFDWMQKYNNIKEYFESGGKYSGLSDTLRLWMNKQMANLKYNRVPENRVELLITLANIINDAQ
ncbi:MAG: hypothetical protein ACTTK1_04025 [Candidatus Cryptobacteroides sp.]